MNDCNCDSDSMLDSTTRTSSPVFNKQRDLFYIGRFKRFGSRNDVFPRQGPLSPSESDGLLCNSVSSESKVLLYSRMVGHDSEEHTRYKPKITNPGLDLVQWLLPV